MSRSVAKMSTDDPTIDDRVAAPRIGLHLGIAGGLHTALLRARELNATAVQIFSRNPRGWTAKPLDAEQVALFKSTRAETGITPVVVHANYLINLASGDAVIREKSRLAFREEVERGVAIGADYLVVHPGSTKGACAADGVRTCADTLRRACEGVDRGSLRILIENTAGQGDCIGHELAHLRDCLALCPDLNLGVCFDTAHAFAAGYDLRDHATLDRTLAELAAYAGADGIPVVHFNDSKTALDSRVDRHANIGAGSIGGEALASVAAHPILKRAVFLLETPQDDDDDASAERDLAALRSFTAAS